MTTITFVREYQGYLQEPIIQAGAAGLDMTERVEHFYSTGYCDPILSAGMGPRYRAETIDVPDWLLAGIRRGQLDGRWQDGSAEYYAVCLLLRENGAAGGWADGLAPLTYKRGRFADSVRQWFVDHGCITPRQAAAVMRDWRR